MAQVGTLADAHDEATIDLLKLILRSMYGMMADPEVRTLLRIMIADGQHFPALITSCHREVLSRMRLVLCAHGRDLANDVRQRGTDPARTVPGRSSRPDRALLEQIETACLSRPWPGFQQSTPKLQSRACSTPTASAVVIV